MKFAVFSVLTVFVLSVTTASAITLYEDPATGQVFTQPGEGRVEIKELPGAGASSTKDVVQDAQTVSAEIPGTDNGGNGITVLNPKSQDFLLGKETHINMKFVPEDAPNMWFKAGVRVQGTYENTSTDFNDPGQTDTDLTDAYLRRARLEVAAGFGEHTSFVMDIRNDKVNHLLKGEGDFTIGDAYLKISNPFDTSLVNFKFFRAKIDVARTETVKSAYVIAYDRPFIADAAAQFISFNRRATNAQMYGHWKKKIHYQIAVGDATSDDKLKDAIGAGGANTTDQTFFYGGKIVLSPFNGWEETKKTETYFGQGKHFSVGAAYWSVPQTKGSVEDTGAKYDLNHELINLEVSAHYKGFFIQSEYFDFQDVVEDWNAPTLNVGSSDGWYVTSEYVFPSLGYIAPFARYETWDAFEGKDGFELDSVLVGVNWYLRGNTTKVGLVLQKDEFGSNIGDKDDTKIRIVSQFFF
jgi:hypothetical protein